MVVRLLVAITILSTSVFNNIQSGAVDVSSYADLRHGVDNPDASFISITAPFVVFPDQLDVLSRGRALVAVGSTIGASLSGGATNRMFYLHNGTRLRLRGVHLAHGRCSGCAGGAVFVGRGSELILDAVSLSTSRGTLGGGIYAARSSSVTATDCTMSSNSAERFGGAIYAEGSSMIAATNCTMSANSATMGGAAYATDNSSVVATDCTMTSNSASHAGGALYVEGDDSVSLVIGCSLLANVAVVSAALLAVLFRRKKKHHLISSCVSLPAHSLAAPLSWETPAMLAHRRHGSR